MNKRSALAVVGLIATCLAPSVVAQSTRAPTGMLEGYTDKTWTLNDFEVIE